MSYFRILRTTWVVFLDGTATFYFPGLSLSYACIRTFGNPGKFAGNSWGELYGEVGDLLFGVAAGDVGVEGGEGAGGVVLGAGFEARVEGRDAGRARATFRTLGDREGAFAVKRNVKNGDLGLSPYPAAAGQG
jgi:hypothetical protein